MGITVFTVVGSSLAGHVLPLPSFLCCVMAATGREAAEWDVKCFDGKFPSLWCHLAH